MRPSLSLLLCLLLLPTPAAAQDVVAFERSLHEGTVEGTGSLAGLEYYGIKSGSAVLTFQEATVERAWKNGTVQTTWTDVIPETDPNGPDRSEGRLGPTSLRLVTNEDGATLFVVARSATWEVHARSGELSAPATASRDDPSPMAPASHDLPTAGTSLWRSTPRAENTVTGDFLVSLFGWTVADEDEVLFETGRTVRHDAGPVTVEDLSVAWLHVRDATLTIDFADGALADSYVRDATVTTDGTTTLTGLPTGPERVHQGVTTLSVTEAGERLQAVVTEGAPPSAPSPAATVLSLPAGSPWLWGGVAASAFVAAFVAVALAARSVPMLEWRSYHALDRHRPRLAAFWANLWTRRDPWDGHAWSARGEARMMMRHDRGAVRDFTKAHPLLPSDERAVNALHAARSHARLGHATQTAHWIGIVASLDLNVLLAAREEPDFARVWDHHAVQRAVRQVLGVGA